MNKLLDAMTASAALKPYSDDFAVAYTRNSKPLRELKKEIKNLQDRGVLAVCPFCKISLPRALIIIFPWEGFLSSQSIHLTLYRAARPATERNSTFGLTPLESGFVYISIPMSFRTVISSGVH
jgi:hypothetical protein